MQRHGLDVEVGHDLRRPEKALGDVVVVAVDEDEDFPVLRRKPFQGGIDLRDDLRAAVDVVIDGGEPALGIVSADGDLAQCAIGRGADVETSEAERKRTVGGEWAACRVRSLPVRRQEDRCGLVPVLHRAGGVEARGRALHRAGVQGEDGAQGEQERPAFAGPAFVTHREAVRIGRRHCGSSRYGVVLKTALLPVPARTISVLPAKSRSPAVIRFPVHGAPKATRRKAAASLQRFSR